MVTTMEIALSSETIAQTDNGWIYIFDLCVLRSNSVQDSLIRGQRQVESVKIRMGLQMDDKHFLSLLNDTQVWVALLTLRLASTHQQPIPVPRF